MLKPALHDLTLANFLQGIKMNTELIEVKKQFEADAIDNTLIGQADNLAIEHENFHTNYIVAGRIALYELLGKIYALSLKLDGAIDKIDQINIMRSVLAEKYEIRTQENTPDLTVLIRYITRADRKTAHVYARAIESAKESGVRPNNMVGFIEHHGGVEKIRSVSANHECVDTNDEKIELTEKLLHVMSSNPIARFSPNASWDALGDQSCVYDFYISARVGNENYVLAKIPGDLNFEKQAIKQLSKYVCEDMTLARQRISELYKDFRRSKLEKAAVVCSQGG